MYSVTYEVLDNSEASAKKITYCEESIFYNESPFSPDKTLLEMSRPDFVCVLANSTTGEGIVGYSLLYKNSSFVEIARFGIIPSFQGMGIGINFIRHLRDMFPSKPFSLTVRKSNIPAISLYRKVGFRTVGLIDMPDDVYLTMYWLKRSTRNLRSTTSTSKHFSFWKRLSSALWTDKCRAISRWLLVPLTFWVSYILWFWQRKRWHALTVPALRECWYQVCIPLQHTRSFPGYQTL